MLKYLFALSICSLFATKAMAQGDKADIIIENGDSLNLLEIRKRKLIKEGDKLYEKSAFYSATPYYIAAEPRIKRAKKKYKIQRKLGIANYELRNYLQAIMWFEKALANDKKKKDGLYRALLAHSYKYRGEYATAIALYDEYLRGSFKTESDGRFVRIAKKGAEEALTSDSTAVKPTYKLVNPGAFINGASTEFGPTYDEKNNLVFSRIASDGNRREISDKSSPKAKLYRAQPSDKDWFLAQSFASNLNEDSMHVGNPSFSPDGKTLYFTKCSFSEELLRIKCSIYRSFLVNGVWSQAVELKTINKADCSSTHPMVASGENGNRLWFASDRKGRGGMDIWYSDIREDSTLSSPVNAGTPINTPYDDISPFFSQVDSQLYFSSEGHTGYGGFDVFRTTLDGEKWSTPKNMGRPVNSSNDDIHFVLRGDQTEGALVSNRVGTTTLGSPTCCDDIFIVYDLAINLYATITIYERRETSRAISNNAQLAVYSKRDSLLHDSQQAFKGEPITLPILPDANYRITAFAPGFDSSSITINTQNIEASDTLFYDLFIDESDVESSKNYDGLTIGTVYWDFDKFRLTEDAPDTLDKVVDFLTENPGYAVEVGSHTDDKGSAQYNIDLSKKRSDAVVRYLETSGIKPYRITAGYYGESKPIAPNIFKDGSDNEEGRAKNRRTEFVLSSIQEKEE